MYTANAGCLQGWHLFPLHRNVNSETITYTIVYPFCVVLAILANILIIYIMRKPTLSGQPYNQVLIRMAISDLMTGLFTVTWSFPYYIQGKQFGLMDVTITDCYIHRWAMVALPQMAHHISTFWIILLGYQRHITLAQPQDCHSNVALTSTGIKHFGIGITMASLAYALIIGLEHTYSILNEDVYIQGEWMPINVCIISSSPFARIVERVLNYQKMYMIIRVIFFMMLPIILIITLTASIIRGTKGIQKERQNKFKMSESRAAEQRKNVNRVTRMLLVLLLIFLAVNGPYFLILLCYLLFEAFGSRLEFLENEAVVDYVIVWQNFGVITSQWAHFLLYACMLQEFKESIQGLVNRLICKTSQHAQPPSHSRQAAIEVNPDDVEETAL